MSPRFFATTANGNSQALCNCLEKQTGTYGRAQPLADQKCSHNHLVRAQAIDTRLRDFAPRLERVEGVGVANVERRGVEESGIDASRNNRKTNINPAFFCARSTAWPGTSDLDDRLLPRPSTARYVYAILSWRAPGAGPRP